MSHDSYGDGFFDANLIRSIGDSARARVYQENQRLFDSVVAERDDALRKLDAMQAKIAELEKEVKEYRRLYERSWPNGVIKHALYVGFKLASDEVARELRGSEPGHLYVQPTGIARSSAPQHELRGAEVLGWVKGLKEMEWQLEELDPEDREIYWENVHNVFKHTFVRCTAPDASPVPKEFAPLLDWKRPDMDKIAQYQPDAEGSPK
jgi:hypothetical protein